MEDLTMQGMGIVFNNAVVLSEQQFQKLLDAINELTNKVEFLSNQRSIPVVEQIAESETEDKEEDETETQMSPVPDMVTVEYVRSKYGDKIKPNKNGKYRVYVKVKDEDKRHNIYASSEEEMIQKLMLFEKGELTFRTYTKHPERKAKNPEFAKWKADWASAIRKATGSSTFKAIYAKMRNVYGIVFDQECKDHKYSKKEKLEMIYYTPNLRELFETCAKALIDDQEQTIAVTIKEPGKEGTTYTKVKLSSFNPEEYGNKLAIQTKGRKGTNTIFYKMQQDYGVKWPKSTNKNNEKTRLEIVKADQELAELFVTCYNELIV